MIKHKRFNSLVELVEVFTDEQTCRNHLTELRWNGEVRCPFCRGKSPYLFKDQKTYKCSDKRCKKKFNVKTKTIFEGSKIPLKKWFIAIYLHGSHKKGVSSCQMARDMGVTQKTAWFMLHRIREMMKDKNPQPLSGTVECDETFVGGKNKFRHKDKKFNYKEGRTWQDKIPVMGLLQRETKKVVLQVVPSTKSTYLHRVLYKNVWANSKLYTDEWAGYKRTGLYYHHSTIDHGKGQRCDGDVHTQNIEGFWNFIKRSIMGVYHKTTRKHLQAYCHEFAFRYNTKDMTEEDRFNWALMNIQGRVKYVDLIGP